MSKKVFYFVLITIFTSLCLISCSKSTTKINEASSKPKTVGNKVVEPEEIISKDEAASLLDTSVDEPKKSVQPSVGVKLNMYNSKDGNHLKFLQIGVTEEAFFDKKTLAAGQNSKTIFEGLKIGFAKESKKVANLGDDAFFSPLGIHILSGNYYITIAVANPKSPSSTELLEKAGKLAVENLNKKVN